MRILPPLPSRRRPVRILALLLAVSAIAVTSCTSGGADPRVTKTVTNPPAGSDVGSGSAAASTSSSPKPKPKPTKPVHVSLKFGDGAQLGVGIPIIAFLSRPIKDAREFAKATKVTVNGAPASGAWYFEEKFGDASTPIEADYRLANYWPGHAQIHMDLPVKGMSAGPGLSFDNNLTLDFNTGPANILTVDDATNKVTVMSDGKLWGTFPTSLGATNTPTKRGVKVIMEKGESICMHGPGYNECGVKWTQRLTYDGEYLHSAPWNTSNISRGYNSSNGCTNLYDSDAKKLYDFLEIGDVVNYPNADGPRMTLGAGYGDWNLSPQQWATGGLYPTR